MIKLIGNGGHAKVVREVISAQFPAWKLKLNQWFGPDYVFIAVGNNYHRRKEASMYNGKNPFIKLIHPTAYVSPSAHIGMGTIVMAGAVIQADVRIGKHCIINTGASVDHDCLIEDFVHVAPGVNLCGGVEVGEGSLLAVGLGFAPNSKIPKWSFVKAKDIHVESLRDNPQL